MRFRASYEFQKEVIIKKVLALHTAVCDDCFRVKQVAFAYSESLSKRPKDRQKWINKTLHFKCICGSNKDLKISSDIEKIVKKYDSK